MPPAYDELFNNFGYDHQNESQIDLFEPLILPEHLEDIYTYRIDVQYKQKIRHSIMVIMQRLVENMINDHDTLWLEMDGYSLYHSVKIKYNYHKGGKINDFTGVKIVMKLAKIGSDVDLDEDEGVNRCWCFRFKN